MGRGIQTDREVRDRFKDWAYFGPSRLTVKEIHPAGTFSQERSHLVNKQVVEEFLIFIKDLLGISPVFPPGLGVKT